MKERLISLEFGRVVGEQFVKRFFLIGSEVSFFHFDLLDTLILLYLVRNFSV